MQISITRKLNRFVPARITTLERSLSDYFPAGTQYFYGYPAGQDSSFVNLVPPETEELVAARPYSCAGPEVQVISFAATHTPQLNDLYEKLGIPLPRKGIDISLPAAIDTAVTGADRNRAIMQSLHRLASPGNFVMAQPLIDDSIDDLYQIPPGLSFELNDKHSMPAYISDDLMPKRLGAYADGASFFTACSELVTPCVIKASASSSGDGVFLCQNQQDVQQAAKKLQQVSGSIIAEEFIVAVKNYGIHFGIPCDKRKSIDILGVNEQITTSEGEFLGGLIISQDIPHELQEISRYLLHVLLPKIRRTGWYGIGGLDVLVDARGKAYFIDCNFRMTGMSAFHFMVERDKIEAPLISFSGSFTGTQDALESAITAPLSGHSKLQLIALTNHGNVWRFNGALSYKGKQLPYQAVQQLLSRNIQSSGLSRLIAQ